MTMNGILYMDGSPLPTTTPTAIMDGSDVGQYPTMIQTTQSNEDYNTSSNNNNSESQSRTTHASANNQQPSNNSSRFWSLWRALILDIPLVILFVLLVTVYCLSSVYNGYFVPFLHAAERTDADLDHEYTYYERSCTALDLSTRNLNDLLLRDHYSPKDAVATMMTHGGVVFPKILSNTTVQALRHYVVQRNANLSTVEKIPVSQGRNRLSFAFDATEDEIVIQALKEIGSHVVLRPMLEELIGPDPAVSEITAITAYYGCPHQTWHQDVKADGNPLKFSRTYTHSYSLFIPLQDTTSRMGATSFCPGSHYCPNDGMADICDALGTQLSEASDDKVWHAGDGALASQHVWHRGAKHNDPDSLERIVLVVSFLARPSLVGKDPRQLSRGTYFHMRWNMWGHSFQDLLDAGYSMAKPWSILRCLGLWKPASRQWGYDLMTSSILRLANKQMGVTYEELVIFHDTFVVPTLHLPEWLQGPLTEENDAWQIYLSETFDKCLAFLSFVNFCALVSYAVFVILTATWKHDLSFAKNALVRLLWTHGMIALVGYLVLERVWTSPVGSKILENKVLVPAFPREWKHVDDKLQPRGPTALPERDDVLVGTRFDAKFLGGYDQWLNYHPGNVFFTYDIEDGAELFAETYSNLPNAFRNQIVNNIMDMTRRQHGRFLYQDYQSGAWHIMTDAESREHVRRSLLAEHSGLLAALHKEIAYMLADYRFGEKRDTALSYMSQAYLLNLRTNVLISSKIKTPSKNELSSSVPLYPIPLTTSSLLLQSFQLPTIPSHGHDKVQARNVHHHRWLVFPQDTPLTVGDLVMTLYDDDEWYRSSIVNIKRNKVVISYDQGGGDRVDPSRVRPLVPLKEGMAVTVNYKGKGDWFDATIAYVHPSGKIDVDYDDGDYEDFVRPGRYRPLED